MTTTKSMKARLADNERKLHIIWNRLNQRFPREEDCLKELIRLSKGRAFRCETCKHSDFEKSRDVEVSSAKDAVPLCIQQQELTSTEYENHELGWQESGFLRVEFAFRHCDLASY